MLASVADQYRLQQRVTALAVLEARRNVGRGSLVVSSIIARYQLLSIGVTLGAMPSVLAEQGVQADPAAAVNSASLLTGGATVGMLDATQTKDAFDLLVSTLVQDAGRTAAAVDMARRPALTGFVRSLNPPACSRCAVLAGRVYRYSTGFQRHPRCDCLMTPTNDAESLDLLTDSTELLKAGQIRGLSRGDVDALDKGADLGQVVNVRRSQSGLVVGSSVVQRAGRLTPQGVLHVASDRSEAITLLRQNGYLT